MTIRARLDKLEQHRGGGDRCPLCPGLVLLDKEQGPPLCANCGRPPALVEILEIIVAPEEEGEPAFRRAGEK